MTDYLHHLRADVDAVLAVLDRAEGSEPVAHCPGWTLRDLVDHLGRVHRWATTIVTTGERAAEPGPAPDDLAPWFAEGADALVDALAASDPYAPTWSFTSDRTAGFWRRRQALETVIHRWDAERAVGEPGAIDADLAADGISEVTDLLLPRQVRLERIPASMYAIRLAPTDGGRESVLGSGDEVAVVRGPAEVLLLTLWHRADPADPRLQVDGDRPAAAALLQQSLAP